MIKRWIGFVRRSKRSAPASQSPHYDPTTERLRQSEQRFQVLIDSIQDYAIYILDPEGFVISWNSGAERIKGYSAQEIVGQHFSRFYTPNDIRINKPRRNLDIAAATGKYEDE